MCVFHLKFYHILELFGESYGGGGGGGKVSHQGALSYRGTAGGIRGDKRKVSHLAALSY